ncbi:MAG TPA: helix-turn-helix transcriptional regulator [Desulfitobacteriaceae bacterium]|nr:helix-turn-helix transcriptional regulator [Desulfitobacteriaceae bacterium]
MNQINERRVSIILFSFFSSWQLAFPFQGQILYALADYHHISAEGFVFGAIAAILAGLLLSGTIIKTIFMAKRLMQISVAYCIVASGVFFLSPSFLWFIGLLTVSLLTGSCVAAWGFYFKRYTLKNERTKTAADVLIYSNILMILLNIAALHISPRIGLGLSMLMLGAAFLFLLRLPETAEATDSIYHEHVVNPVSIVNPLALLCLFIVVITINSGLMYQVINPAFKHLGWLTSWYWATPYIISIYIMSKLSKKTNCAYILNIAIAMIGFSFILFMLFDRSAWSYIIINTLMLGACGIFDLFWWSILGEMLDLDNNPAKVFGIGLSANVLGVLLGGLIGKAITASDIQSPNTTLLALGVVCITLVLLPLLQKSLLFLLKEHAFLTMIYEIPPNKQNNIIRDFTLSGQLTEREGEIAALLLMGKTYRIIAEELHLSKNTVKTHVKNIYSKTGVQNRTELINRVLKIE